MALVTTPIKYIVKELELYKAEGIRVEKKTGFNAVDLSRPFYPTDQILCHLAKVSYKEKIENEILPDGWQLFGTGKNEKDGFKGCAFWNREERQLVISHKGTKNIKDIWADFRGVVGKKYTSQIHSSCTFAFWVLSQLEADNTCSVSITGHSLGGWLSQITTFAIEYTTVKGCDICKLEKQDRKYHPHTVVFDSPGCYEMLCELSKDYFHRYENNSHDLIAVLDITIYFIAPNLVNSKNEHVARLLSLDFKVQDSENSGILKRLFKTPHTIKYHKSNNFVNAFAKDVDEISINKVLDWPKLSIRKKMKNKFGFSGKNEYQTFFQYADEKNDFNFNAEDYNKDSIIVHHKTVKYDKLAIPKNIFKPDEVIFLENWKKLKENQIHSEKLNGFFFGNNLKITFDDFLPNFEINKDEVKSSDVDNLKKVINRIKWLLLIFPQIKVIMREQILEFPFIFEAMYKTAMNSYIQTFPNYKIEIHFKDALGLEEFLRSGAYQILHLTTKNTKDETFRVYDILQKIEKYQGKFCIFSFRDINYLEKYVDVAGVFGSGSTIDNVLVIDCEDTEYLNIISKFNEKLLKGNEKKIIFIGSKLNLSDKNIPHQNMDLKKASLTDIDNDSINCMLHNDIVSLNGHNFKLNDFLKANELIKSNLPFSVFKEFLIHGRIVEFNYENNIFNNIYFNVSTVKVVKEVTFDILRNVVENYESKLRPIIQKSIEKVLFLIMYGEENPFLNELAEMYPTQIVLYPSYDQDQDQKYFHNLCSKNGKKTIFRLHLNDQKENTLTWLEVFDPDLYIKRKFKINEELVMDEELDMDDEGGMDEELVMDEKQLMARNKRIVLISNSPGMGKSTTLLNLAKNTPNSWIFWINLLEAHRYIEKSAVDYNCDSAVKFLLQTNKFSHNSSNNSSILECLLKFSIMNENSLPVYLFFDAFDEIQDSKDIKKEIVRKQIINLLKYLKDKTFAKIFISTREYDCNILEKELKLKSIKLEEVNEDEQIQFCSKFWVSKMSLTSGDFNNLDQYAEKVLTSFNESIEEGIFQFLGIPLQLRMIVEIFQPDKTDDFDFNNNLYLLYSKFIDRKYDIYFKEKTCFVADSDKDRLKTSFQKEHRDLSLRKFFPDLSSTINYSPSTDLNRIGLVQINNDHEINFIHQTFAEYFAAEEFVDSLERQPENVHITFVKEVLGKDRYFMIRNFINSILITNKKSSNISRFFSKMLKTIDLTFKEIIEEQNEKIIESILENIKYSNKLFRFQKKKTFHEKLINSYRRAFKSPGLMFLLLEFWQKVNAKGSGGHTYLHITAEKKERNPYFLRLLDMMADDSIRNDKCEDPWDIAWKSNNQDLFFDVIKDRKYNSFFIEKCGNATFHLAVENNRIDVVIDFIDKGINVLQETSKNEYGRWDLIKMLLDMEKMIRPDINDYELTKELLSMNNTIWNYILQVKDKNFKTKNMQSFLHFVAHDNQIPTANELIKKGADVNCSDIYGNTPILLASSKNHWDLVVELMKLDGCDVTIQNVYKQTVLCFACEDNQTAIALDLIKKGADVNCSDIYGSTPILLASFKNHWDLVVELMKLDGCDVTIQNVYKKTVLGFACEDNQTAIALDLIKKGADVNISDIYGNTPIMVASSKNHCDLVVELMKLDGCDVTIQNLEKETVLHFACKNNQIAIALDLIKKGADVNCSDIYDNTPIMVASSNNHCDLVVELMKLDGCDVTIQNLVEKETVLHLACMNNQIAIALDLIKKGADVNCSNICGNTPIMVASSENHWDLVVELMKLDGCDVTIQNFYKRTVLCFACTNNQIAIALDIIKKGADVNCSDIYGNTPIMLASSKNHWDLVLELMKLDYCDVTIRNDHRETVLHFACMNNQIAIALDLIKKGANVNCSSNNGNTPIMLASSNNHWDLVVELMKLNHCDVTIRNDHRETVLHFACMNNQIAIALDLIKKGGDVNCSSNNGNTPIMLSSSKNYWGLVVELMKLDNCDVTIQNDDGETVLHLACMNDQTAIALDLIKKGADVNCSSNDGFTPLLSAAREGHWGLVIKLMKLRDCEVNIINHYKENILHFACRSNNTKDIILDLIKEVQDINAADEYGNTPLLVAAGNGHWDLVLKLIEANASVNITNRFKENLLHLACRDNEEKRALDLIQSYKFDINFCNSYGRSPVFFAAENGHWKLVEQLIDLNADPNIPDKDKTIVLHFACRDNMADIVMMLIDKGSDPNATDIYGISPLSLVVRNENHDLENTILNLIKRNGE